MAKSPIEAAFFDLDKTLLPGAALFPLAREMYRQHMFTLRDIARLATDQISYRLSGKEDVESMERAREASLTAVRDRRQEDIVAFSRTVAEHELFPRFYPQAVDLINKHRAAGRETYISSSSPEDFLRILGEELGVTGVVGTRAEVVDGVYTGRLLGEMCHREEKARRVRELAEQRDIDLARSYAYTDSINDLPLLETVGNPVAMNPDRKLLAEARRRGWQVIDLRTARRRTLIGSAFGMSAVAAGSLGYLGGYLHGRRRGRRSRSLLRK
jgi:HAD superfamily hydrolase (TIGR01490 family)